MADDDWHRPVFTDWEWRWLARERFEHDVLQGFEGTAEERRRLLGRHIFTDKDVEDVRGEYEGCWQQIEFEQDERRRQARVGTALQKLERRFEAIRIEKAKFLSVFDDSDDDDDAREATDNRRAALSNEAELLTELELLCAKALGCDVSAIEEVIILPPGMPTYERIERTLDAVKERLAARPSDGDFSDEDLSTMSVCDLEFNRFAELKKKN